MKYEDKIASGIRGLNDARQFQELFPCAEHVIVQAKHDFYPEGWKLVQEWISRAKLHDRYVLWLVVPIEFTTNGVISALDEPAIFIVEVEKVEKAGDDEDGPKWECNFGQFKDGDWKELVEAGGDFAALGIELIADAPVDQFAAFWRDTRPAPDSPAPDGLALHAPLRFMS